MQLNLAILSVCLIVLMNTCDDGLRRTNPYDPDITMATFIEEGYTVLEWTTFSGRPTGLILLIKICGYAPN